MTIADMAIFPFIRQCASVDQDWFEGSPYKGLQQWLNHLLNTPLFTSVMVKYAVWKKSDDVCLFPKNTGLCDQVAERR